MEEHIKISCIDNKIHVWLDPPGLYVHDHNPTTPKVLASLRAYMKQLSIWFESTIPKWILSMCHFWLDYSCKVGFFFHGYYTHATLCIALASSINVALTCPVYLQLFRKYIYYI